MQSKQSAQIPLVFYWSLVVIFCLWKNSARFLRMLQCATPTGPPGGTDTGKWAWVYLWRVYCILYIAYLAQLEHLAQKGGQAWVWHKGTRFFLFTDVFVFFFFFLLEYLSSSFSFGFKAPPLPYWASFSIVPISTVLSYQTSIHPLGSGMMSSLFTSSC